MIYLDNAATTPISLNALKTYDLYAKDIFFNPSSIYDVAVKVKNDIQSAKDTILNALKTSSGDIIFTSSATEANNLAIFGSLKTNFKKIVLSMADHPSIYNIGIELENKGYKVDYCPLQENGQIDYDTLENILDENTSLISIIHVCNETGAVNDLKRINEIRQKKCPKAIFHADGVQAFSKIKINLDYFGVDLYTISGHKMFAPKGIACLYVKNGIHLKPIFFGGGQEHNLRSGTENVPAIMALKTAVLDIGNIQQNYEYVTKLKKVFILNLKDVACIVNSSESNSPYILSLSFRGVNGETLVHMLEQKGIYISTGSACSSRKKGNRILSAMNIKQEDILGSVRVSFSTHNTIEEIEFASLSLKNCYIELLEKLR